jgi:hypothetical protein
MNSEGKNSHNLKRTARIAGLLYLINAITAAIGYIIIPAQIVVTGDLAATAQNLLSNEFMWRIGIFCSIGSQIAFLFLGLTLFRLFENVSRNLARTLLALVIAAIPIAFFLLLNQLSALQLLGESAAMAIDQTQRYALVTANLDMAADGLIVIGVFWGLWLIPFGMLVYESKFIPKVFGVLLIAGGVAYLIDVTAFILLPAFQAQTNILVAVTSTIAEIGILLWLLIKGTRSQADFT